jgi:hypothetical protein
LSKSRWPERVSNDELRTVFPFNRTNIPFENPRYTPVELDEDDFARTAAQRFKTDCPNSCKEVKHLCSIAPSSQEIEERFLSPRRNRASCLLIGWTFENRSLVLSARNSQHAA